MESIDLGVWPIPTRVVDGLCVPSYENPSDDSEYGKQRIPSHALLCVSFGGAMDWLRAGVAEISGQFPFVCCVQTKVCATCPRTDISFVDHM